ncbi:Ger(x)C family spore germination protein [Bacillus glycinifermentans]|uniref:Ger(x)C family spore germination protein n=1 Tax=Bacillus glycinifermentans TaxID=1664069 RepID=UPI002DBF2AB7|nr:Ger(x)C family spore germination protein [Bacillus glycinifermentans]MEC3609242.1 Ger(x)C family spore germination protein [Bacillus glycinifermentans]
MKKIRFLSAILLLFLTGCWSNHEIEERGLTFGMGFDKGKETSLEKKFDKAGGYYPKKDRITITYQYVNEQAAGGSGGTGQKSYINVYETGDSVQQITTEIALRKGPVYGSHLKVIVIAADLLRTYSFDELLDQPLRDDEIRPSSIVLVTRGRARDTLELKETGEMPAFHLRKIVENAYQAKKILPPVTLAKMMGKMRAGTSYLIQNVASAEGEVKYAGAAAINGKTNKLIGFLNEHDLDGVMWIIGQGRGGTVKSYDPKTKKLLALSVESINSKIKPIVKGNRIAFQVHITSEGHLAEKWSAAEKAFDNKFLERTERKSAQTVKKLAEKATRKMQKEYKADLAGFGNELRIKHPRLWDKLKNNWDERFTEIPITIHVQFTIKDYGTLGQH